MRLIAESLRDLCKAREWTQEKAAERFGAKGFVDSNENLSE